MLQALEAAEKPQLTVRQREIYEFLKDLILNRGYGPTVREIGAQFGIRSPNGVMCHLKALEKKGLITRESHMSRAIQLADSPHDRMTLQMVGQVSANAPIRETELERIDFAALFDGERHFLLKAKDDSYNDLQIAAGDQLVLNRQDSCKNGELVVAVVSGKNAVLGRFYRDRDGVRIDSGSDSITTNDLEVVGVVTGVIRQYS